MVPLTSLRGGVLTDLQAFGKRPERQKIAPHRDERPPRPTWSSRRVIEPSMSRFRPTCCLEVRAPTKRSWRSPSHNGAHFGWLEPPSLKREPLVVALQVKMKMVLMSPVVVGSQDVVKRSHPTELAYEVSKPNRLVDLVVR
jgi:hypothetical protein